MVLSPTPAPVVSPPAAALAQDLTVCLAPGSVIQCGPLTSSRPTAAMAGIPVSTWGLTSVHWVQPSFLRHSVTGRSLFASGRNTSARSCCPAFAHAVPSAWSAFPHLSSGSRGPLESETCPVTLPLDGEEGICPVTFHLLEPVSWACWASHAVPLTSIQPSPGPQSLEKGQSSPPPGPHPVSSTRVQGPETTFRS